MNIYIKNLIKKYNNCTVLNIEELELNKGDVVGIIGPNGSGKTTLAEIILKTKQATCGEIKYNPDIELWRRNAIFQETSFDNEVNLLTLLKFYSKVFKSDINDFEVYFKDFGLEDKMKKKYNSLSGGQKQRYKLMIAFINNPDLLLLDEVSNSLDFNTRNEIVDLILGKNLKDKIILMISHEPSEVFKICNRIIKLSKGEIVFNSKKELLNLNEIEELMKNE